MSRNQQGDLERGHQRTVLSILHYEASIRTALGKNGADLERLKDDLAAFHDLHDSDSAIHSFWVHRLAHFLGALYEHRLTSWVNRLTAKAFAGEEPLHEWINCFQVAKCFTYHAKWEDAPAESSLTPQNVSRLIWPHPGWEVFCKSRISISPFESEVAFQRWQLLHPRVLFDFNTHLQCRVLPLGTIKT